MGGFPKGNETILKNVFYQGLRGQMKTLAAYKHDAIIDYDRFKIAVRRIEVDMNASQELNIFDLTYIIPNYPPIANYFYLTFILPCNLILPLLTNIETYRGCEPIERDLHSTQ